MSRTKNSLYHSLSRLAPPGYRKYFEDNLPYADIDEIHEVFVGRIRRDESREKCLNLWIVSDNLRKGAATNAIQIAEYMVEKGLVRH